MTENISLNDNGDKNATQENPNSGSGSDNFSKAELEQMCYEMLEVSRVNLEKQLEKLDLDKPEVEKFINLTSDSKKLVVQLSDVRKMIAL
eukprot:CAMPEP_0116893742 /NCGR_PEP_ID=MMETSP0467-20121206/3676_1 /TAXON_ID=283647 /ORGANISM="Mesodinium pulex, Strain SPMC105" /LENGTH=89 /DNA_ID=CAMNT_0004563597 /DNA_START=1008 /DNA_END=1280 /DNA_ORIENTATION=+